MTTTLLYGPSYQRLVETGLQEVSTHDTNTLSAIRWLEHNDHNAATVADSWAADHPALHLEATTLDDTVRECYEALAPATTNLDALTRRQLVDQALRTLDLEDAHRHRGDVIDLLTTLEEEGYDSPEAVTALVEDSPLSDRASRFLANTYDRFTEARIHTTTDDEYTRSQAYRTLLEAEEPLADLLPHTEAIVLSGYHDLGATERAAVTELAHAVPTIVLLPVVDTPDGHAGPNEAALEAFDFYRDLADDVRRVAPKDSPPLADAAGRLFTPGSTSDDVPADTLRWVEAPTPDREVRQVARSLRKRLATEDVDPEDVLVVVPGLISYREHVEDVFPAHGVDTTTFANKLLYQTHAGDAMLALVSLCEDESTPTDLARLATNPVVSLDVEDHRVADLARRLPTTGHERLLEELDDASSETITDLLVQADRVAATDGTATIDALRSLFAHVDLETNVEEIDDGAATFDAEMEHRAYRRVDRALNAIERVTRTLDLDDVLERVRDELDQIRVPPPRSATDGVVEVVGPRDAYMQSYDHLYLVGLTAGDFPPNPDRPRFFEELEDGLSGVDTTDERAVARYQFATMLASAESVYVTTPETTADDDPMLESPILDELARVTGLEPTEHDLGHGSPEDVQREISRTGADLPASDAVERAITEDVFEDDQAPRVRAGVTCAEHRAAPRRTEHDGLLDPDTVDALHPTNERTPYSPTRLSQYASCGFQYVMERVLDVEAPDEFSLEPDPLDLGSLVHDVLEAFYTDLQDAPGETVDLRTYDRPELERRILDATDEVLEDLALPYEDAFYRSWLTALLAGLGDPDCNDYYHPTPGDLHGASRGLFAHFLDVECNRDAQPGWFEVGMDLTAEDDAVFDLELPDGRTVPIGGRIDRVTVDRTEDPNKGIVHDYKTGNPSQADAVDGISFQLPLYALAAGDALESEDVETPLDAAFYALDPPNDVTEKWTLRYYSEYYGDATDEDYARFVEEVTPRRIGDMAEGIEGGAFHPTVLDEDTAGCRYCDYSDVCDVRYHTRRDVVDGIDADGRPGYVPQYAREDSLLDSFGGEAE